MRTQGFSEGRVGFGGMSLGPMAKALLIYYAAVFVVGIVLRLTDDLSTVQSWFAFVPAETLASPKTAYRVMAYLALHSMDIFGFLMNLLSIFFIGSFLESSMGSRRLLSAFLFSGVFASVGYLLVTLSGGTAPLLGPSTACLGLLACAATLYPRMEVIFLIFPLPMWAVAAVIAFIHGAGLLLSQASQSSWALLFGLAGGALFAWNLRREVPMWKKLWPQKIVDKWKRGQQEKRARDEREEKAELDRILGKISESGIGSLTAAEKKFLDRRSRELRH